MGTISPGDTLTREEFDDLREHVLEERERLFRGAVDVLEDTPRHPDLEGAWSAGQLRVGG